MGHPDAEAHAKLDRLLATQERHTAKFNNLEAVLTQLVQTVPDNGDALATVLRAARGCLARIIGPPLFCTGYRLHRLHLRPACLSELPVRLRATASRGGVPFANSGG
jgi:radical SAM superfamily enzyme with C-terminal helix-hairpin-helix motif